MKVHTVYVAENIDEYTVITNKLSIPVISSSGMVSQQFVFDVQGMKDKGYKILKETEAVLLSKEDAKKIKEVLEMVGYADNHTGLESSIFTEPQSRSLHDALQLLSK